MILEFLRTYIQNVPTVLPCPYSTVRGTPNPTEVYLHTIPTKAANNVVSLHEVVSSNQRPTFWNGTTNPPEQRSSTILMYIRSKMSSDSSGTPKIPDGDYANISQSAEAFRDLINRISQMPYDDGNGNYVINQIRPVANINFERIDAQGRYIYVLRFEALWTWDSTN